MRPAATLVTTGHQCPTPHASSVLSIYCPAPHLVCRPTAPRHVSARAAPGSALVVRADSLLAIVMTIRSTLNAHPDPPPRALACIGINVTTLRKSEDA
uniref:Uncharacterized protein n=1 Tax=Triticum urartu TaxID=4572 RepID=A0A8R7R693_TRIUA